MSKKGMFSATVYAVWSIKNQGYVCGKTSRSYSSELSRARIYARKNHATSSVGHSDDYILIPFELTIPPETVLQMSMGARPDVN